MRKHILYKSVSFILLPVAALLAALDMMMLFTALANPPMLLPVFMMACVSIYIFTSFSFLNKGIIGGRPCKPVLKDWIKVNAYVAIIAAILMLVNVSIALNNPALLSQPIDQVLAMQPNAPAISKAQLLKVIKALMYFFGGFSILLLLHIVITFRLLKQYGYVFNGSSNDPK
jgi:hypothetical protein